MQLKLQEKQQFPQILQVNGTYMESRTEAIK